MNESCDGLSLVLDSARDLEHALAVVGDFILCNNFTNARGHDTAADRSLSFDVERARSLVRAITTALVNVNDLTRAIDDVSDNGNDPTFDGIRANVTELGRTLDSALVSALALNRGSNSLERARGLAIAIDSGIDRVLAEVNPFSQLMLGHSSADHRHASPEKKTNLPPPFYAEYVLKLLASLASPGCVEDVLGDFRERHQRQLYFILANRGMHTKHAVRLAQINYWWQVLRSAPGFLRCARANLFRAA